MRNISLEFTETEVPDPSSRCCQPSPHSCSQYRTPRMRGTSPGWQWTEPGWESDWQGTCWTPPGSGWSRPWRAGSVPAVGEWSRCPVHSRPPPLSAAGQTRLGQKRKPFPDWTEVWNMVIFICKGLNLQFTFKLSSILAITFWSLSRTYLMSRPLAAETSCKWSALFTQTRKFS